MKNRSLKNIKISELKNLETTEINGGCFAYDVGWALGFSWEAITHDFVGMAIAISKYKTHEH